jgi:hypothetical protein
MTKVGAGRRTQLAGAAMLTEPATDRS